MRILITGAGGFIGPYLVAALRQTLADRVGISATSRTGGEYPELGTVGALDVTNSHAVKETVARYQPTHIVHLAGMAAISASEINPQAAWMVHLHGTLNVASAIRERAPDCALLFIGSGQVYGASAKPGLPLDETTLLAPGDDYSVTKAAADLAVGALAVHGLRCIRLRPFNHTGPGQSDAFVVPGFAMQIARIEAGLQPPVIRVGNLDAERDFLDVRDVAGAYALAVLKSQDMAPGTILNVASGEPRRVRDILDQLLALSRTRIRAEEDPARMRPSDLPRIVGDAALARRLLGWSPEHRFDETLAGVLEYCRSAVSVSRSTVGVCDQK